jgi:hypothetical protein
MLFIPTTYTERTFFTSVLFTCHSIKFYDLTNVPQIGISALAICKLCLALIFNRRYCLAQCMEVQWHLYIQWLASSYTSSTGWVRGVAMHPTTQIQVPSWTDFRCKFLFLMKNHLVPPRFDLIFFLVQDQEKFNRCCFGVREKQCTMTDKLGW